MRKYPSRSELREWASDPRILSLMNLRRVLRHELESLENVRYRTIDEIERVRSTPEMVDKVALRELDLKMAAISDRIHDVQIRHSHIEEEIARTRPAFSRNSELDELQ